MNVLQVSSLLIVIAGLFGAINYLWLRLPSAIGILVVALLASLVIVLFNAVLPSYNIDGIVSEFVGDIAFSSALLDGMLGLLLFAGALHVKIEDLRGQAAVVLLMATLGVAISTAIIGFATFYIFGIPLLIALVYGALITPTDPVAVLGVLREANLRKSLETKIAGESLFNDGVGYVVFLVLAGIAFTAGGHGDHSNEVTVASVLLLFAQEAFGGALLGAVLGWLAFRLIRRIDDFSLEVLLTLGLALGGYQLALAFHLSGPIFAVIAGLFIGDVGVRDGMSETTREYVERFWTLIDEILNAVLFLLIGLEVFAIDFAAINVFVVAPIAIALSLIGRFGAVAIPIGILRIGQSFGRDVIPIMTWGGLKGGISVALALSLPENEWKPLILTMTYCVVIFTIIVQGLTIASFSRRFSREPKLDI